MSATTFVDRPPALRSPHARWRFWHTPAGRPRWERPALLGIAALAALLYAWNIADSDYAGYYAAAVRSMSESWKAFLFTSFDPGSTVTLDKAGGFLWPQALSARIFGFSNWALTLPQCVEGVVSVLVVHRTVRRWRGPAAGLLAAGALTLTPVVASMFGHALLEAPLTMCLVLAADQGARAMVSGRLRPLLLAAVWVGLAFQAAMMQAWIIVPAMAVAYFVVSPATLRKRLGHLLTAGAVLCAVSLSWVLLMTVVPQDSRPYVDGSRNNSALSMVFGYNGFDRLGAGWNMDAANSVQAGAATGQGGAVRGGGAQAGTQGGAQTDAKSGAGTSGRPTAGGDGSQLAVGAPTTGWLKLFRAPLTQQIGWLFPLALCALVLGLVTRRKQPRTDPVRGGYLLWGGWLLTAAAVMSAINVPHATYMSALAPGLAALSAAGVVTLWRAYRKGTGTGAGTGAAARPGGLRAWALPGTVAVQAAWAVHLVSGHADWVPWLIPLIVVAALASLGLLVYGAVRARHEGSGPKPADTPSSAKQGVHLRRIGTAGLIAGCLTMAAAPATWSLSVLDPRYTGSAHSASAGPQDTTIGTPAHLTDTQRKILDYVERRKGTAEYTFSAALLSAEPYIRLGGAAVLPLGGFAAGTEPVTLETYRRLVASGKLRFALVGDRSTAGTSQTARINRWVRSACEKVDPSAYGGETGAGAGKANGSGPRTGTGPSQAGSGQPQAGTRQPQAGGGANQSLYRCSPEDARN
ncbi:mannosyl transferase [Streptomyces albofaciens JCM 4342]|uniref:ArnT family glycosyltransferase n=1 Tax=Streptomyces albofaciens TaxID=66866 RepID=UPI0012390785|nr:glycosyltransferase family 39 protein [Streptomyces albofaciens]KAA6223383.1 mannosyl transferase [Streptomyces albofaciens JCM 4342]